MTYPVELQGAKAPVLMWAQEQEIEESALQQLRDVSELPGLHGLRVMPDVHWGNGATVGSVIAMEQALAPAAVGVDIGCGVNAVRTSLYLRDLDARDLKMLRHRFEKTIPVGFNMHDRAVDVKKIGLADDAGFMRRFNHLRADVSKTQERAHRQMGTLGNGNHFIELTTDSEKRVWITLHSGSRGVGNELAKRHIEKAKGLPQNADLPKHLRELSLFYKGSKEMEAYLHDLNWAQEFAMRSRTVMMELVKHEMEEYFERFGHVRDYLAGIVDDARRTGFTETILGRRRYLPPGCDTGRGRQRRYE